MRKCVLTLCVIVTLLASACHKDKMVIKDVAIDTVKTHVPVISTFTLPAGGVVINPTGNSPLSALLIFSNRLKGHTEIVIKGKHGIQSDIKHTFTENDTTHTIPIIGLYADYKNTVQIAIVSDKGDTAKTTLNLTTAALPLNMPNYIHVDVADYANMESGMNLVSNFSTIPNPPFIPYMIDNYGDIRWLLDFTNHSELKDLSYDDGIFRLKNGNFLFADQSTSKIYEVDILGKIVKRWGLGGYNFHHEVFEKPDGNFLLTVNKPGSTHTDGSPTIEDYIIEINRISGSITNTWDLKESLDEYRTAINGDLYDWMHANAVNYDSSDNTIVVSGRVQGVVKLTYDNKVKWILAPHRGWGKNRRGEDLNQFLLQPLDKAGKPITDAAVIEGGSNHTDFEWNWYQHSPIFTPDGHLMLFDNGDTRNFNPSANTHYSRAVEYKIDEVKKTVQQVWAYGKDRKEETYSRIVSCVKYLPNKKHVLFSPGFQVPNATGRGGKIVEVDYATGKVVFQMSLSSANEWGFHRVLRMELYPNNNPYR